MAADENIFTFDTTPFTNGLKKISNGISGFQKGIGNMAKSVSRGVMSAVAKIGLLGLAFKGVKTAISEMPEIGKTFQIAKGIIMKNLLYPLRKTIYPLLQKFLDWVRDNRAMFVRWGQTLVGVFTSVKDMVGKLVDTGLKLGNAFKTIIERTFGIQLNSFQDLINILTFRFAVLLEFVMSILNPIIKAIGDLFTKLSVPLQNIAKNIMDMATSLFTANESGNSLLTIAESLWNIFSDIVTFVAEMVDSFITGFKPTLDLIINSAQALVDNISRIVDMLFSGEDAISGWKTAFEAIGGIVGKVIVGALDTIAGILGIVGDALQELITGVPASIRKTIEARKEEVGSRQAYEEYKNRLPEEARRALFPEYVDDALITKDGQVIKFSPDDNILAFKKGLGGGGDNVTVNIDFKGMNINVSQATPDEAQRFGENIVEVIRRQLSMELERTGAY